MPNTQEILDNCRRAADDWHNIAIVCEEMVPLIDDETSQLVCRTMAERYRTSARAQLVLMQSLAESFKSEAAI